MIAGQKVVCIDGKFPDFIHELYTALPVEGDTYTVRDVMPGQDFQLNPEIAITLVELHNPRGNGSEGGIERAFNAERFAPLEEADVEQAKERTLETV